MINTQGRKSREGDARVISSGGSRRLQPRWRRGENRNERVRARCPRTMTWRGGQLLEGGGERRISGPGEGDRLPIEGGGKYERGEPERLCGVHQRPWRGRPTAN